jgi:hypothetical protein
MPFISFTAWCGDVDRALGPSLQREVNSGELDAALSHGLDSGMGYPILPQKSARTSPFSVPERCPIGSTRDSSASPCQRPPPPPRRIRCRQNSRREDRRNENPSHGDPASPPPAAGAAAGIIASAYHVFHERSGGTYHFVRSCLEERRISMKHVRTEEQHADILTKPLPRFFFQALKEKIGVQEVGSGHQAWGEMLN